MYDFEDSIQKVLTCCRSLLAGCYGSVSDDIRRDVNEIVMASHHFISLTRGALNAPPDTVPDRIVHDLYNPLNAILGYSEIMLDLAPLNVVQRIYVQIVMQTGRELTHAVDMSFRNNIRGMA